MEIRNLETLSVTDIAHHFNEAFVDYKIPMKLTAETMAAKIKSEHIQLQYSAGAFVGGRLVGFILAATDTLDGVNVVYNAGTGVLPNWRGKDLGKQMYRFLVPTLSALQYHHHVLEVFADNDRAKKVYLDSGFQIKRNLDCYKGAVSISQATFPRIRTLSVHDERIYALWDVRPSWQNDMPTIRRNPDGHELIGIEENGELLAYAAYLPQTGRVKQISVKPTARRNGLGSALMQYIMQQLQAKELMITCAEKHEAIDSFLRSVGLQPFLPMHEMWMHADGSMK